MYPDCSKVVSDAVNPISAWLMIHTFQGKIQPNPSFDDFLKQNSTETQNFDFIKKFYNENDETLSVEVPLNQEKMETAYRVFRSCVNDVRFLCERVVADDDDENKTKRQKLEQGGGIWNRNITPINRSRKPVSFNKSMRNKKR